MRPSNSSVSVAESESERHKSEEFGTEHEIIFFTLSRLSSPLLGSNKQQKFISRDIPRAKIRRAYVSKYVYGCIHDTISILFCLGEKKGFGSV